MLDRRFPLTAGGRSFYPDGVLARQGERTSAIALSAVGIFREGERVDQQFGWRRGYGRSRAALELGAGVYRVFALERIDALEYSIRDRELRVARAFRIKSIGLLR